jgi:pyridoxamine 5'-phosphate oxidase
MKIKELNKDPLQEFKKWFQLAIRANLKQPESMTLSTSSPSGQPSSRTVLLKGVDERGFRFFTNYKSDKARALKKNPKAALLFYWSELDCQIRIEGRVRKLPAKESDAYWNTRPRESRLSALASPQSSVIPDLQSLEKNFEILEKKYMNQEISRPSHWGGYLLVPKRMEFWFLGRHRLHDRFVYIRKQTQWDMHQLAP